MASLGEEQKMSNFMDKSLTSFTFSPKIFAYFASHKNIKIQHAMYRCFIELIWAFAEYYDDGQWSDNEGFNLYAHAKTVQDALTTAGYSKD